MKEEIEYLTYPRKFLEYLLDMANNDYQVFDDLDDAYDSFIEIENETEEEED